MKYFSGQCELGNLDKSNSYEVQLIGTDSLSEVSINEIVPLAQPAMKFIGNSAIVPTKTFMLENAVGVRKTLLDTFYPVGSIYMSRVNKNPSSFLGGTWVEINNRFLVSQGTDFLIDSTGGKTTYGLKALIGAAGNDVGRITYWPSSTIFNNYPNRYSISGSASSSDYNINHTTPVLDSGVENTTSSLLTKIIPPYLSVYMWYREN